MKKSIKTSQLTAIVLGFFLATVSHAVIILQLETTPAPGGSTTLIANPGDTISLATLISTTGEQVSTLSYRVVLPASDWTLNSRNYTANGWGTFFPGTSTPAQGAGPTVIDATAYNATPDSDFLFEEGLPPFSFVAGLDNLVETFSLSIPLTAAPIIYNIQLVPISANDPGGTPFWIPNGGPDPLPPTANFTLNLSGAAVPEPGTTLLALVGLLAVFGCRARLRANQS